MRIYARAIRSYEKSLAKLQWCQCHVDSDHGGYWRGKMDLRRGESDVAVRVFPRMSKASPVSGRSPLCQGPGGVLHQEIRGIAVDGRATGGAQILFGKAT